MSSSDGSAVQISAQWAKPVVPDRGGEAILLVRIVTAAAAEAGLRRAPVDVAFILDRSGSMSGEKLALVKEAVSVAIGRLRDEDRLALVVYDDAIDVVQPLATATPRRKTAVRLGLHGVDARGSTNLAGGWLAGCHELSNGISAAPDQASIRLRRAILLTDGLANVGMVDPTELTHHAGQLRRRGISTTALGVGLDFDEFLLSGMAEAGGGNFQFIEQPHQLPAFFAAELGELLANIAGGFTLSLALPRGVRATLVNPFPVERTGKRLDIAIGDLAAGTELNLIFRLTARAGAPGTAHQIRLDAAWADPAHDRRETRELLPPSLLLVDDESAAAMEIDPLVAEQAALLGAAAERREAMRLDRAGHYAASRQRMQQAMVMLRAAPATADILEDLATTTAYAGTTANVPYSEHTRKSALADSHRRSRGKS